MSRIIIYHWTFRCDRELINNSGQSASEIAKFWGHQSIFEKIESTSTHPNSLPLPIITKTETQDDKIFFGKSFLSREAHRRKDTVWIKNAISDESTVFVIFNNNLEVLVTPSVDHSNKEPKTTFKLLRGRYMDLRKRLEQPPDLLIFLGTEHNNSNSQSKVQERAWFAFAANDFEDTEVESLNSQAQWLQPLPGVFVLDPTEAGIYAQARSILAWHDRYGFCPTCGNKTTPAEAGYKRECGDDECRSRKGVLSLGTQCIQNKTNIVLVL